MGQVSVTINGRSYQVACDDGQESHLIKLANFVDSKVSDLSQSIGQIGDTRLLLMASIMISDEIFEQRKKIDQLKLQSGSATPAANDEDMVKIVQAMENLSKRLSNLADSIEAA